MRKPRPSSSSQDAAKKRAAVTVVDVSLDENPDRKFTLPLSITATSWDEFLWAAIRKFVPNPPLPTDTDIDTLAASVRIWKVFDNEDSVELDLSVDPREADICNRDKLVVSIDADALERLAPVAFDDEEQVDAKESVEELKKRMHLEAEPSVWIDLFQRQTGQKKKSAHKKKCIRAGLEGPFHLAEFSSQRSLVANDKGHRLLLQTDAFFRSQDAFLAQFEIPQSRVWVFILCHGGKFAGAVYQGGKCLAHKTFSRYVIRKKQGGRQVTKDRSTGGSHSSAGSYMRRYHEQRLTEEVQQLLQSWRSHIDSAYAIYLYAPGLPNKNLIFASSPANDTNTRNSDGLLDKADPRIRVMPVRTARATLPEIQGAEKHISHVEWFPPGDCSCINK